MYAHVRGIDLFYEKCGSGRPLLLVHGNGEDHTIFHEGVNLLKDRFTCYAIDSRCHGSSTVTDELHYQDMADDLVAFMEQLDLSNVLFYGFSDGGILGLLAAMKTDRITALVTSGANVTPDGVKPLLKTVFRVINLIRPDDKLELMLKEPHITAEDLAKIRAKTLVLAGEKDVVTEKETEFIAENIPGAELHIIPSEGHGSYIVHSEKFVRYLVYADTKL
jgi:pimeloyl-ACP methyl ester carboxylesterase